MESIALMATVTTNRGMKAPNPYVGPPPFRREDRERFFGRDREKADLYSLVAAHRTVLLYAQSGAGKTSLLNAKLIPELEEGGFDVLTTTRFSQLSADLGLGNKFRVSSEATSEGMKYPLMSVFKRALADHARKTGSNRQQLPRVLIFDQFEEFFTSHSELWEQRRSFFEELNRAMEAEPSLRALFAMREDFVASIDPYEDLLPEEFRTRYRLERLRPDAALEAIEKPLAKTGIRFGPGVARHLVESLLKIPSDSQRQKVAPTEATGDTSLAGRDYVIEEYVEPVQLQVVCFSLYRKLADDTRVITDPDLAAFGDVDEALREFYNDSLVETVSSVDVSEDMLRQWFEQKLITVAGTRGLVFRGEIQTEGLPNAAVDALDKTHIIREEVRGQSLWYELSHDRFIRPVLRANDAWRARVRAAEREKREAESLRLQKEAKRFQTLARALGFSLIIALLLAGIAGLLFRNFRRTYSEKEAAVTALNESLVKTQTADAALKEEDKKLKETLAQLAQSENDAEKRTREARVALSLEQVAEKQEKKAAADSKQSAETAEEATKTANEAKDVANKAKNESENLRRLADQQSRFSKSRALAAISLNQRAKDPQLALWLALYSVSATASDTMDGKITVTEQSLEALLGAMPSSMLRWGKQAQCGPTHTNSTTVVDITKKIASLSALALTGTHTPTSLVTVTFTPDSKSLAALDRNGGAYTFDVNSGEAATVASCDLVHPAAVTLSSQGSLLAVTRLRGQTEDSSPSVTMGTRSEIAVSPVPPSTTAPAILKSHWYQPEALAFNSDGTMLGVAAGISRRTVYKIADRTEMWDSLRQRLGRLRSRVITDTLGQTPRVVTSVVFSTNNKLLAVGAADGTLELWDVQKAKMTRPALRAHSEAILGLAFSPDNRLLATSSRDRTALIWDVSSPRNATVKTSLLGHKDGVISVAFDPTGKIVATGSQDQTIGIWDASSGQILISLPTQGGYVTGVSFSMDGRMLASVNSDGSIVVWNTSNLDQVKELETRIRSLQRRTQFSEGLGSVPAGQLVELLKLGEGRATRTPTLNECAAYLGSQGCPASPSASYK
jgi:WD40 repeat protein